MAEGKEYVAKSGDCISSIAFKNGFFWETIWNHGNNSALKDLRKDPNILMPGDKVFIPEKVKKVLDIANEATHTYKLKGVPAKLKLRFLQPPDPPPQEEGGDAGGESDESNYHEPELEENKVEMVPVANVPYVLDIDGVLSDGQTDGDGCVELPIPPNAKKGKITLRPPEKPERVIPLDLGGMDPVSTITGARKRLSNLGFSCVPTGDKVTRDFTDSLKLFQHDKELKVTGELDQPTQDKLLEVHGC